MRVRSSLVLVSLVVVATGGCTIGGTATPSGNNTQATTSKPSQAASSRPRVVDLKGLDECKTLTSTQQKELKTARFESDPLDISGQGSKAPTCHYDSDGIPLFGYSVSLVTDKGIEFWAEGGNLDVEPAKVGEFPAKQVKLAGTKDAGCSFVVDTADGQAMYVKFVPITKTFTPEQQCDNAKKAAEFALTTIQTLR